MARSGQENDFNLLQPVRKSKILNSQRGTWKKNFPVAASFQPFLSFVLGVSLHDNKFSHGWFSKILFNP